MIKLGVGNLYRVMSQGSRVYEIRLITNSACFTLHFHALGIKTFLILGLCCELVYAYTYVCFKLL